MDKMQRKIESYERSDMRSNNRKSNQSRAKSKQYTDLLSKYNDLMFRFNNRVASPSTTIEQPTRISKDVSTNGGIEIYNPSTYNTDGLQTQQMGTYEYMQEAETENNSENIQATLINQKNDKNSAQTTIQYLQKEIDKYQAQAKFYKTKYQQVKSSYENLQRQMNLRPTNWAAGCGPANMTSKNNRQALSLPKRSSS